MKENKKENKKLNESNFVKELIDIFITGSYEPVILEGIVTTGLLAEGANVN